MPGTTIFHVTTELLIWIFTLSLVKSYHRHIRDLLLVCRHWNNILMNTPDLWTGIHITLRHRRYGLKTYNPNLQGVAAYCQACLDRSCGMPLKVTIDASELHFKTHWDKSSRHIKDPNLIFRNRLCDILGGGAKQSNAGRWEELRLLCPSYDFDLFAAIFALKAPRLNLLEVSAPNRGRYHSNKLSKFVERSSLKTAIINRNTMVEHLHPRFANLTSLNFNCASRLNGVECDPFQRLPKMESLETLTLRADIFHDYPQNLLRDILLPRLNTLTLSGDFSPNLLQCFKLPALHRVIFITHAKSPHKLHFPIGIGAQPTELFWELPDGDRTLLDPGLLSRFWEFLLYYDTITIIKLPSIAKNPFMDMVKSLHEEGRMPYDVLNSWVLDDDSLMMEIAISLDLQNRK